MASTDTYFENDGRSKHQQLVDACAVADIAKVDRLLGESFLDRDCPGLQAGYHAACAAGHACVVRKLLSIEGSRGINVHTDSSVSFRTACKNGHVEVVELLLSLRGERYIDVHDDNPKEHGDAQTWHSTNGVVGFMPVSFFNQSKLSEMEGALRAACLGGSEEVLTILLGLQGVRRIDPNAHQDLYFTVACGAGKLAVVNALLGLSGNRTVDPNACNDSAFHAACKGGHVDVVRELLALEGDNAVNAEACVRSVFNTVCSHGFVAVFKELLSLAGRRVSHEAFSTSEAFGHACFCGRLVIARELLALEGEWRVDVHCGNEEAFASACGSGNVDLVRLLLSLEGDRRVDVRAQPLDALSDACQSGNVDVLRELLSLTGGRKLQLRAGHVFAACRLGSVSLLRELLAHEGGDELKKALDGQCLAAACAGGKLGIVCELLRLSEDPDSYLGRGGLRESSAQALILAIQGGHVNIVQALLENDEKYGLAIKNGATWLRAVQAACGYGRTELLQLLVYMSVEDDTRADFRQIKEACFMQACESGCTGIVHELLRLRGRDAVDLCARTPAAAHVSASMQSYALKESAFAAAFERKHVHVVRELARLTGERRVCAGMTGEQQRDFCSGLLRSAFKRGSSTPLELVLLPMMLPYYLNAACQMLQSKLTAGVESTGNTLDPATAACSRHAQHVVRTVFVCSLRGKGLVTPAAHAPCGNKLPHFNALLLCCVLPAAQCQPLLGQLSQCNATLAVQGRLCSLGNLARRFHAQYLWGGVSPQPTLGAALGGHCLPSWTRHCAGQAGERWCCTELLAVELRVDEQWTYNRMSSQGAMSAVFHLVRLVDPEFERLAPT